MGTTVRSFDFNRLLINSLGFSESTGLRVYGNAVARLSTWVKELGQAAEGSIRLRDLDAWVILRLRGPAGP